MAPRSLPTPAVTEAEFCRCGCGRKPTKPGAEYVRGHRPGRPTIERFDEKVRVGRPTECWTWLGAIGSHGYGSFWLGDDRWQLAHRYAYEIAIGAIPAGYEIDHLCRNRLCVNPDHLEAVTQAENKRRAMAARPPVAQCRHGHAYDPTNTIINSQGYRECRACLKAKGRAA